MTRVIKGTPVRRLSDAEVAATKPTGDVLPPALYDGPTKRDRPRAELKRQKVVLKMDPHVIATFKAGGPGWRMRMNEALRLAAAFRRAEEAVPQVVIDVGRTVEVVALNVLITPEDRKRMRQLALDRNTSLQKLGHKAWGLLLGNYGLPPFEPVSANVPSGRKRS